MKITRAVWWREDVPLARPYTIAFATRDRVTLFVVRLETTTGQVGLGSASPAPDITGETLESCEAALETGTAAARGSDPRHLGRLTRRLADTLPAAPAARAALDMAFYDLFGHMLGVPVVDLLGRCHQALPTSITIGIKSTEEAVEEAREYMARGFRHLKVKIGHDLERDSERLRALRAAVGGNVHIRIDGNQGYSLEATRDLGPLARALDLELIEQPLPRGTEDHLRRLDPWLRQRIAADESIHDARDALALALPDQDGTPACGILNIKLMKCGGLTPARNIAAIAESAGQDLMWGCMDESVISIAAALSTALASPHTRFLDLDGSLDLARDVAQGGFHLKDGIMAPIERPGLGIDLAS